MAIDVFLDIEGVRGESQDARHPGEVEVLSYSFGVAAVPAPVGGGGAGAGRPDLTDLHVVARQSRATVDLLALVTSGRSVPSAVLSLRRASGDAPRDHWTVTLDDCVVTAVNEAASAGEDAPLTSFSLAYRRVTWSYRPRAHDGSLGAPVEASYDTAQGS